MSLHLHLYQSQQHYGLKATSLISKLGLLPGQPKILEYLLDKDGARPGEIATGCLIDKSTVANLLRRMEQADLIYKQTDPQDNRAYRVYLSQKGRQLGLVAVEKLEDLDQRALSDFSDQEVQDLESMLGRIIHNLNQ